MKKLFTIFLALITLTASAQLFTKKEWRNLAITSGLMFTAGAMDGTSETLKLRYDVFADRFPGANPQFWDYNRSWPNKWKNGDPAQGEAFWQSSRALAWTTDGYHLTRTCRNALIVTAITIKIGERPKKWYKYVIEAGVNYLAYGAGFSTAYDLYFKH